MIFAGVVSDVRAGCVPGVAPGSRFPVSVGPCGLGLSGSGGEGAEPGEDLGEQPVPWSQSQDQLPGVADEAAGHGDQPPPEGFDHRLAAADAVAGPSVIAVSWCSHRPCWPRAALPTSTRCSPRHDRRAGAGAQRLSCRPGTRSPPWSGAGAGLDGDCFARIGHVQAGQDERVGVDRAGCGQVGERQRPLIGVQGPAAPRTRGSADTWPGSGRTRRISSRVVTGHRSGSTARRRPARRACR